MSGNVLGSGSVGDMLSIAKGTFSTSYRGAFASARSRQMSQISRGRLGYPKPLAPVRIGISNNARALTQQFLQSGKTLNLLLSSSLDSEGSIEGLQKRILALRAVHAPNFDADAAAREARGSNVDTEA